MTGAAPDASALAANAAFMDKYSRQIGAFGMEAMSKLIQLKVNEHAVAVGRKPLIVYTMGNIQIKLVDTDPVYNEDHSLIG
jgi:hypothetical protein